MKILLHSNAPWTPTGYGQQIELFAPRLARHADVAISASYGLQGSAITHDGIRVYPGLGGTYGNESVQGHARDHFGGDLRGGIVISLLDAATLDIATWSGLNAASWVPVDHDPATLAVKVFLANSSVVPIAMSRFGESRLSGFEPLYVPHGVDTAVMRPRDRSEARARFGIPDSAFVVGLIGMNKGVPSRKGIPQALEAFAALRRNHDDAVLYMHTEPTGTITDGLDLHQEVAGLGLGERDVIFTDSYRYLFAPFSRDEMALLYSAMDVLLNPSMCEGFGLPVLEAHACGVPAIVTDFSAMSEVCGAGWKVGFERVWSPERSWVAIADVGELAAALEACHAMSAAERNELGTRAREHALAYDADRVLTDYWLPALEQIEERLAGRRPFTVAGRAA